MRRSSLGTPSPEQSDESLVAESLAGNRDAYRALVERYQARIVSLAFDIVKNREDAEDIAQESFVKAFLSLDKFKGQSSFYTWIYRIAFNMSLDVKRRLARRGGEHLEYKEHLSVSPSGRAESENGPEGLPITRDLEGPHEALHRKQAAHRIQEALAALSDEHRAVVTLREIDGLNYDEISEALGIPRGTVMSRLFYARKALQKALKDFAPSESAVGYQEEDDEMEHGAGTSSTGKDELLKRNLG